MNLIFYCVFIFLWGITKGIDIGMPRWLSLLCIVTGGVFWLLKVVRTKYTMREIYIIIALLSIGLLSYGSIRRLGVMVAVMIVIGAKGTDYRQVLKVLLSLQIILMVSRVVPELLAVSRGAEWSGLYQGRKILGIWGGSEQYRISLGFQHPNELQKTFFMITALIVCVFYERLKKWQITLLFLMNIAVYVLTFSNTGLAVSMLFFLMVLNLDKHDRIITWVSKNSRYIFVLTVLSVIFLCVMYSEDSRLLDMVNRLLTGRVRWAHEYINSVRFSLLGRDIENAQVPYKGLDCGYIHVLLRYGTVILAAYCIATYELFKKMHEKGLYVEVFLMLSFQFYFVMENFLLIGFQNYTWMLLGCILLDDNGRSVTAEIGSKQKQ